jgi:hypothetical protein
MKFSIEKSIEILERTPNVLISLLTGVSEEWLMSNEGPDTWSPYDIVGHLIHGEKTDWITRMNIILSGDTNKTFKDFDRFAQMKLTSESLEDRLKSFANLRTGNILMLKGSDLNEADLDRTGVHPQLGEVSLRNLLSTWVAHDLGHLAQVARVMATQYNCLLIFCK